MATEEKKKKNLCFVCGKPVGEFSPLTGGTVQTKDGRAHFTCIFPEKKEEVRQKNRSKFNQL